MAMSLERRLRQGFATGSYSASRRASVVFCPFLWGIEPREFNPFRVDKMSASISSSETQSPFAVQPNVGIEAQSEELISEKNAILIVDDEQAVRDMFGTFLSERYECVTAANAQEALERLAEKQFALVLSDLQMPGLSGVELTRRICVEYLEVA